MLSNISRLTTLCLLLCMLAGCTLPFATSSVNDGRTTISFAAPEDEVKAYETLAERFMADNPTIRVQIVSLADLNKGLQKENDRPTPDDSHRWTLTQVDTTIALVTEQTVKGGMLLNLKPLADADASFQREDFYPGMLEFYQTGEGLWAIPRARRVDLLAYNRDLFEAAGVPLPQPGWTWEELLRTAEQLTRRSGSTVETYGLLGEGDVFELFNQTLLAQGVRPSDPIVNIPLDHPSLVALAERMRQLRQAGVFASDRPTDPNTPPLDVWSLRREGRLAMWGVGAFQRDTSKTNAPPAEVLPFQVGYAAYPAALFSFGDFNARQSYVISAGTAHPQEAWRWIDFLSRQPGLAPYSYLPDAGNNLVPARKTVADQTGFWQPMTAETREAMLWTLANQPAILNRPVDLEGFGALGSAWHSLMYESKHSPQEILATAQRELDERRATLALTPTPEVVARPFSVATPQPALAPSGTPVRFALAGRPPANLPQLMDSFKEAQPDINLQLVPTNVFTQGLALNQLSQASDCFLWSGPPRPVPGSLNLQPLVDADARFPLADYPPALLAAYQNEQGLTGLPYTLRQQALHIHQEAFAAVNQPLPTADWTPEQFLAAAKATTSGSGSEQRYGYVPYSGPLPDMLFFIRQFGGRLFTGSGGEQRASFSDPQVLAAVNWYLDLARVHGVTPPLATLTVPSGGGSETAIQLVRNGGAAMWLGQTGLMAGSPGQAPFSEGMAPLPVGRAGLQGEDLWVESLHISASSPVASQCWAWLSFLAQRGDMLLEPGVLPARRSVQEDALGSL
nr:extracellular solute-binding protein [Chloroflexaceae bacterium]